MEKPYLEPRERDSNLGQPSFASMTWEELCRLSQPINGSTVNMDGARREMRIRLNLMPIT